MSQVDLTQYTKFVEAVTSKQSNDHQQFVEHINQLDSTSEVNLPLLLTAAIGLAAEGGEFCEIPKKIFFQGKPLNEENIEHMKRELGDVIWYWINACRALNLDPNDVIEGNVHKLEARYPGGAFDVRRSEDRKSGDI